MEKKSVENVAEKIFFGFLINRIRKGVAKNIIHLDCYLNLINSRPKLFIYLQNIRVDSIDHQEKGEEYATV